MKWCLTIFCRGRCCLHCQRLAHCSPSMLFEMHVPIKGHLHECQGMVASFWSESAFWLIWTCRSSKLTLCLINIAGCLLHPQHSLSGKICLRRFLTSQFAWSVQEFIWLHRWVYNNISVTRNLGFILFWWIFFFSQEPKRFWLSGTINLSREGKLIGWRLEF